MAPLPIFVFGLILVQGIQGVYLNSADSTEERIENYFDYELQEGVEKIQDILLIKLVDMMFIKPAMAQIKTLGQTGYIEECIKFVETLKTIPKVAKDVAAAVRDAAKDGAAEIKKLFKCRSVECIRDMEFELKDFVNSLPDRFRPSLKEVKDTVLKAKGELEECLGIVNGTTTTTTTTAITNTTTTTQYAL